MNKKSELVHCLRCRLLAVVEMSPRSKCVYTRHPHLCHATICVLTSQPTKLAKIGMRIIIKTLSDRRHKNFVRVNTASGANWLREKNTLMLPNLPNAYVNNILFLSLVSKQNFVESGQGFDF